MRFWCKAISHFLTSNSRHGTHSPFVYRLADEVLYRKTVVSPSYDDKPTLLLAEIQRFYEKSNEDAAFFEGDIADISLEDVLHAQQKYFMLFIKGIYSSSSNERKWKIIVRDNRVGVTIDLFYFAIICWRKEQPKEYFKLRFPYWKY